MSLPLERYKNISGVKKNQGGAESSETGLFSVKHEARKNPVWQPSRDAASGQLTSTLTCSNIQDRDKNVFLLGK